MRSNGDAAGREKSSVARGFPEKPATLTAFSTTLPGSTCSAAAANLRAAGREQHGEAAGRLGAAAKRDFDFAWHFNSRGLQR